MCARPPRSPTIVGSAVETIVWSSDASSITSISPAITTATCGCSALLTATDAIGAIVPARSSAGAGRRSHGVREQEQPEAREADHDREHPVLRARRLLHGRVDAERAVVREHEAGDVAGDE